jgi:pyridoxal phosphate-dependent aminotransferase EpsN
MKRIYLSPPHLDGREKQLMVEALESNWITTLGPQVDAFEREMSKRLGIAHAAAVSSGTAALHLSLMVLGVKAGDEVICSDLTFAATANAITYCGATPVFIDSSSSTWNMDPGLLEEEMANCQKRGRMPGAVIVVDLYGQCADYRPILEICNRYEVPVIEDAAEALGGTYGRKAAGTLGVMGVLSFNGNKIITTSGGGMVVSDNERYVSRARFLATQARDPAPHYQHSTIGYNYRMSNLLAAIGRGQLEHLELKVARRREINAFYREALRDVPGIEFMSKAPYGTPNCWLTCILINTASSGMTPENIRLYLESLNIESRPLWKPMHMQPIFGSCRVVGGSVAERLFETGLCLPSGSGLSGEDLERIVLAIKAVPYVVDRDLRAPTPTDTTHRQ